MKNIVIILASGSGTRLGGNVPKQFLRLGDKMVVEHTLRACDCGLFDKAVLVVNEDRVAEMQKCVALGNYDLPIDVVAGGSSRMESCKMGVDAIDEKQAFVVVHNGAQPFVSKDTLKGCLNALRRHFAVVCGIPCVYTVLEVGADRMIRRVPPRAQCFRDMGPEGFRLDVLRKLLAIQDDTTMCANLTSVAHRYGLADVFVAEGDSLNIKITYPLDVEIAKCIIRERQKLLSGHND